MRTPVRGENRSAALAALALLLIYAGCALLVDPRGEFPLNDDWSYTRSAFGLAAGEGIRVDEWAAPSLVGQALYGGALAALFGPSFTMLRLSTIALSCAFAVILWCTLWTLGVRRELVWIAALSWAFNPVQFCLAYSFMTEVPFLLFVGLGTFLYVRHLQSGSRLALGACAAALGYAFLIRQMAVLFIGPLILTVAVPQRGGRWKRSLQNAAVAAAVSGAFVVAYGIAVAQRGGATPATQRKYELLRQVTFDQIAGNSFGILFYVSFTLLPLAAVIAPLLRDRMPGQRVRAILPVAWALVAAVGWGWFHWRYTGPPYLPGRAFHARMPFLLNILYDTGLGPVTLDPTYYGAPETPVYPRAWMAVTVVTAAALIPIGILISRTLGRLLARRRPADLRDRIGAFAALSFLSVALFEIVFSHVQEGGLFDRHVLTAAFPVILMTGAIPGLGVSATRPLRATRAAALAMLAVLGWFSVAGTHDYLAWNRIRWELGRELLATGVDPLNVSFGFEFNGWYNYDAFRRRGGIGKVYYWWRDREDYVIAMAPQESYRTLKSRSYHSWVHRRPVRLYLLEKADPPNE